MEADRRPRTDLRRRADQGPQQGIRRRQVLLPLQPDRGAGALVHTALRPGHLTASAAGHQGQIH